jgi:N-acetylneuraminate lyase
MPAVVTPFDEHGRFDAKAFERLLAHVYAGGVDGVYVGGTTGEGPLQSTAQRMALAEAAVAGTPRGRHVVVHVGASSPADAIALAQHAGRAGAHAISSLPPLGGSFSFDEIRDYYRALAETSTLPLIVYYFPAMYPALASRSQLEAICALPGVAGFKYTSFDLFTMASVKRPGLIAFNGHDEVLLAGLLMGADGGIGSFYNIVPELFVRLGELARAKRWEEARPIQEKVNRLIAVTLRFPLFPAIKQILAWAGLPCGTCLAPRGPLTSQQQIDLRAALTDAGFGGLLRSSRSPRAAATSARARPPRPRRTARGRS